MNKKEIKNFLRNKPGYLKKSGQSLHRILLKQGYLATPVDCRQSIKEVKQELKSNITFSNSKNSCTKNCNTVSCECKNSSKVLIYDIETSPNIGWFWRAGYKQNVGPHQIIKERAVICVSYKWLGEDQVYNLVWDKHQDDRFLIEQFIEVLNEADLIVAHNGDRFDIKWLKTRALYHGLPMLINYPQFDTLKVAKKKFYFNSNRLDYISKFLGFEGKNNTTPELWNDICIKNDRSRLTEMLEYCDEDVRQLEKVYNKLVSWELPKLHAGVLQGKTKLTSPISGGNNIEHVKMVTTNRGTIKHIMKDLDTGRLFEMSDTNYKKHLKQNR